MGVQSAISSKGITSGRVVIAAGAAHFFVNGIVLSVYPVFAATLGQELRLSATDLGLLMSATSIAYALIQIPAGMLSTKYNRSFLLVGSTALMGLGCLLFASVPQYGWLLFARAVMGVGAGFSVPLVTHVLSDALDGRRLVRGMGIFGSGWGLGTMFAFFGLSIVGSAAGWRWTMVLAGAVALLIALGIALALPGHMPPAESAPASVWSRRNMASLLLNRNLIYLSLINISILSTRIGVVTWAPSFLNSRLGSGVVLSNAMTGIMGLVWFISPLFGGELAARLGKRVVIISSMAACVVLPLLFLLVGNAIVALILLALVGWFTMFYFGSTLSTISKVVPAGLTGVAAGLFNCLTWTGPFLSPFLFGVALDATGQYTFGFIVLSLIPLVGVYGALALWKELGGRREKLATWVRTG